MKKFILALLFVVAVSATTVFAAETYNVPTGRIVIGTTTIPSANIAPGWDNISTNAHVRRLIFDGLNTMERDMDGEWFLNPAAVRDLDIADDEEGNRTYTFTIRMGNRFSDGTYITAAHYVANIVFFQHEYFLELADTHVVPVEITSVRLLSDEQFSVTVDAEFLPFIWEHIYKNHSPLAHHAIIPDAALVDHGDGAFFEGLTQEMMETAVMDELLGFRHNPSVTPGPYRFMGIDLETMEIFLEANPYFPGTWDGYSPRIRHIAFRPIFWVVDELMLGNVDMVSGQSGGAIIDLALDWVVHDMGTHNYISYARNGYGLLHFHVDHGPTQFVEVRQAIKWLTDRELITEIFNGGHGIIAHGPFSPSMWMYQEAVERGLYDRLNIYYHNPDKAVEILESGGWVLNGRGRPFRLGIDDVRYKHVEGYGLMRLEIKWPAPAAGLMTETLRAILPHEMEAVGMQLTQVYVGNPLPLASRTGGSGAEFHMFSFIINFGLNHSPWMSLNPDPAFMGGGFNTTFSQDQELFELANRMRFMDISTDEGREEFIDAWIDLMAKLTYQVQEIPLFNDIQFDFIPTRLQNWSNNANWGVAPAIVRAYVTE